MQKERSFPVRYSIMKQRQFKNSSLMLLLLTGLICDLISVQHISPILLPSADLLAQISAALRWCTLQSRQWH